MFPANPNPFLQMPGKIVLDIKRKRMPSGQIVEARKVVLTVLENGRWRKENVSELDPGTSDGTSPDIEDIRECHVCLGLFHKYNVSSCVACGHDYCKFRQCCGEVPVAGKGSIFLCAPCAKANNTTFLGRISRKFWRLQT